MIPQAGSASHDRMLACLGMAGLTWRERCVLAALASFDGPGGCFPAEDTIAELLGLHRQRIAEAKQSLRRKGRLRWRRGHGERRLSCTYEIAYRQPFQSPENPDIGQSPENPDIDCPENPDMNLKEQGDFLEDLCHDEFGRRAGGCTGQFVEPGGICSRCGWQRPKGV